LATACHPAVKKIPNHKIIVILFMLQEFIPVNSCANGNRSHGFVKGKTTGQKK